MIEQAGLIEAFVAESVEMLEESEAHLIEMTADPARATDPDTLATVFRMFHSLKGSAGFMNLSVVQTLTHAAENVLARVRDGTLKLDADHVDLLVGTCDFLRSALDVVARQQSDAECQAAAEPFLTALRHISGTPPTEPAPAAPPAPAAAAPADASAATGDTPGGEREASFATEATGLLDETERLLGHMKDGGESDGGTDRVQELLQVFQDHCSRLSLADPDRLCRRMVAMLAMMRDGPPGAKTRHVKLLLDLVHLLRDAVEAVRRHKTARIEGLDLYLDLLADHGVPAAEAPEPAQPRPTAPAGQAVSPEAGQERLHDEAPPAREAPGAPPEGGDGASPGREAPGAPPQRTAGTAPARHDIRVDVTRLDQMFDLMGELVVAETLVTQNPDLEGMEIPRFAKSAHELSKIIRELHQLVMLLRMVPVVGVFRRMKRLVHDLSRKSGKSLRLELTGEETEVDKSVAELIADPLVHMIRNAVDHGIEAPADRERAGKPATGTVALAARHEGNDVCIDVRDDGRGLDRAKLLDKARETGLVQGDGSDYGDEEVFRLIFQPGFSTNHTVSDISGRGVGMDVVQNNLEKLKGRIEIHNEPGRGCTFTLRIPLTLAMIEGMLMRVGASIYTVPILAVDGAVRVQPHQVVRTIDGNPIVRIRGELLPVIPLYELHHIVPQAERLAEGIVVVLQHRNHRFGLLVDELLGIHQTVIKGMSGCLKHIRGISGCAILGNGDVSLILDVGGLLSHPAIQRHAKAMAS